MLTNGYIRLHRALNNWRWYKQPKVLLLWLHLLLNANYDAQPLEGHTIGRGQLAASLQGLSEQTGLTVQEVRTVLAKLKKTGEITTWSNRHMTIITIPNYDFYQSTATDQQQTINNPATDQQQTINNQSTTMKEDKEDKEIKKAKKDKKGDCLPDYEKYGFSSLMRERLDEWLVYKWERREPYKPTGLNSLLVTVSREIERLGEAMVLDRITLAMASGWRGMNLDKVSGGGRGSESTVADKPLEDWEKQWLEEKRRNIERRRQREGGVSHSEIS